MRSQSQLMRLLNLVPYLTRHQGVAVARVAEDFKVSPDQIMRDLEVLQFCGLPDALYDDLFDVDLDGARMDGHIFFRNAEVLGRPMRMRRQEATSLLLALDSLVAASGGSSAATSAAAKLQAALGGERPAVSLEVTSGDARHQRLLADAIERHVLAELEHRGSGRSGSTRPVVEPARIRVVGGYIYLDAWSRLRSAWRSYRLDRVSDVRVLDEAFVPRPGLPPDEDWFSDTDTELTLRLEPGAAWLAEYYPVTHVEPGEDEISITFPVGSRGWATSLLLRLGAQVLDVSDPAIASEAASQARAALEHYGARGS